MEQGKRNLDVTTSSMDVMALNNLVVSMRSAVKQSRVQIINKLTQQIRRYRKKKGSKEQVVKFQKKADRLKSEIDALKHVKIDQAAKSALACNISFEDAAKEGNIERRAIARLASHKLLQPKVDRFRKEHDDWKSLAAFMLSKNTGRRFKKKKTKKTPTNYAAFTGTTKVNEKQAPCTEMEAEMSDRSELAESETEQGDEHEDSDSPDEGSVSLKAQLSEPECYSPSITRDDQCPQSDDSPDDHSTNQYVTTTILQSKSECPKAVSKSVTPKTFRTKPKDSAPPASTLPHQTGTAPPPAFTELDVLKETKSAMKSKLKSNTDEKTTRKTNLTQKPSEMVVQTLNLDEFNSESDIVVKPDFNVAKAEDLSFLYTAAEGNDPCTKKPRKKMKDPFFVGESGSEEEETSSEDAGSEGTSGKTETQSLGRKISKNMVQSSFIDTLSRASSSRIREKRVSRQVQEAKHQRPKMGGKPFPHPIQKVGERKKRPGKSTPRQSHDNTKGRTLQSGGATTAGGHITEKEPETKLHPSWEASKKRKQQVAGVKAFCGKKIKFDDDS